MRRLLIHEVSAETSGDAATDDDVEDDEDDDNEDDDVEFCCCAERAAGDPDMDEGSPPARVSTCGIDLCTGGSSRKLAIARRWKKKKKVVA